MSQTGDPFSPAAAAEITLHMNRDRVDDNLMIVHALGRKPTAIGAQLKQVDPSGASFQAMLSNGTDAIVTIPWEKQPCSVSEIRGELDRMYAEACAQLGVPPQRG